MILRSRQLLMQLIGSLLAFCANPAIGQVNIVNCNEQRDDFRAPNTRVQSTDSLSIKIDGGKDIKCKRGDLDKMVLCNSTRIEAINFHSLDYIIDKQGVYYQLRNMGGVENTVCTLNGNTLTRTTESQYTYKVNGWDSYINAIAVSTWVHTRIKPSF